MTQQLNKMPSFNTVVAGTTAVVNLPVGLTYHSLELYYSAGAAVLANAATLAADIDEIRVTVDGEVKQKFSAAQLQMINGYYNHVSHFDGVLPIQFSRPWMRVAQMEDNYAYGTSDVQTMTLEVDINAAAVTPALSIYAWQSQPSPLGLHCEVKRFPQSYAGAGGEFEIPDLPRNPRYGVFANHIDSAVITSVVVEANQRKLIEGPLNLLKSKVARSGKGRVWQAGWNHFEHAILNRESGILPMALEDYRLKLTLSGADASFDVIQERVLRRSV